MPIIVGTGTLAGVPILYMWLTLNAGGTGLRVSPAPKRGPLFELSAIYPRQAVHRQELWKSSELCPADSQARIGIRPRRI